FQAVEKLIAEARAGNRELLARYIETGNSRNFTDELRAFLGELVRNMPPGKNPKRYAAFQRNRDIAWFIALRRREGSKPEEATNPVFASGKLGRLNRRTVQRAWRANPDLHNPFFVDFVFKRGPEMLRDAYLPIELISEVERVRLEERVAQIGRDIKKLCALYQIKEIGDLPACKFDEVMALCDRIEAEDKATQPPGVSAAARRSAHIT